MVAFPVFVESEIVFCLCFHVQCLQESGAPELQVRSSSVPHLKTSALGTTVWVQAAGSLYCGSPATATFNFDMVHRTQYSGQETQI